MNTGKQRNVVGVDGCPAGWFAVRLFGRSQFETTVFGSFEELVGYYDDADLILVDIPIGLPEDEKPRECDVEARKRLGRGASSRVFPAPTRQGAEQARREPKDFDTFCRVQLRYTGKKLSKQAFAIASKIAEVDSVLRGLPLKRRARVREVHPEICFWALNGQHRLSFSKKASARKGYRERMALLRHFEPLADMIAEDASGRYWRKYVGWDDIADALAAAVTGCHGYDSLQTLPANPPSDAKGLPMEMVYWTPPAP